MLIVEDAWPDAEPRRRQARRRAKAISARLERATPPPPHPKLSDEVVDRTIASYRAGLRLAYHLPDVRCPSRLLARLAASLIDTNEILPRV